MSAFTPEQWALAGEFVLTEAMRRNGTEPTEDDIREARDAAVWIATGKHLPELPL